MMDHERHEKELQEFFQATQQAYRTLMEDTIALQERTLDFARKMLESVTEAQAEHQTTLESFVEQSKKQREAMQNLLRQMTEDYMEVIKTPFSHHHQHLSDPWPPT